MMTVTEISKISGVSVRALHHYDSIGLLKPVSVTASGYRLYDESTLERLQQILLLKELMFSLKDIKEMLDLPGSKYDSRLSEQIQLLEMQRDRLDRIIAFARTIEKKEKRYMDFSAFDNKTLNEYKSEAKARWGNTAAYAEYEEKAASAGSAGMKNAAEGLMALLADIAALRPAEPGDAAVATAIAGLQQFITQNFYHCTDEIFAGLGQMYVDDPRMKANIDAAAGEGAAEFISAAIADYCRAK